MKDVFTLIYDGAIRLVNYLKCHCITVLCSYIDDEGFLKCHVYETWNVKYFGWKIV